MRLPEEKSVLPATTISPVVGCSRPATERSVVVLPHPEGPSKVYICPSSTAIVTPSTRLTGTYIGGAFKQKDSGDREKQSHRAGCVPEAPAAGPAARLLHERLQLPGRLVRSCGRLNGHQIELL